MSPLSVSTIVDRPVCGLTDLGVNLDGQGSRRLYANGVNVILNPDIRRNMQAACRIAIDLAHRNPTSPVLLVNSYAGEQLLSESLRSGLKKTQVEPSAVSNMQVVEVFFDTWNPQVLKSALEEVSGTLPGPPILILNSLEFAAMSSPKRLRVVRDILQLQKELSITWLVFSHTVRGGFRIGVPSVGPLGLLVGIAQAVYFLCDVIPGPEELDSIPIVRKGILPDKPPSQNSNYEFRTHTQPQRNLIFSQPTLPDRFYEPFGPPPRPNGVAQRNET